MLRKARPDCSFVCIGSLPRLVYLAGADRAGLTAAQHLLRKVRASPDFYAEQELRPVGPGTPDYYVVDDNSNCVSPALIKTHPYITADTFFYTFLNFT